MAFIEDLTPYTYYRDAPDGLAIGWLDETEPFTTGQCPADVRHRLAELIQRPVRLMRGYHYCQFCCRQPVPPRYRNEAIRLLESPDVASGNGEIWVTAADGTNYAAPTLIGHYIDEHNYLSPEPYLVGVRGGTQTPINPGPVIQDRRRAVPMRAYTALLFGAWSSTKVVTPTQPSGSTSPCRAPTCLDL